MKEARAKILLNEKVAPERFKMALEAPSICKSAKAGQFVMVKCSYGIEPFLRRPLSFHRIGKRDFELLYQVIGEGTKILSQRKKGERLDIIGPLGNGFDTHDAIRNTQYVTLVAGGIAVAPLVALAEELKTYNLKLTVLIGAKTKGHLLCEKEFKKLGAKVGIATEDGSRGYKGLVTNLWKSDFHRKSDFHTVYACGPKAMLREAAYIAKSHQFRCQVSFEERMACGTGACLGCAVKTVTGYKMVCKDGPVFNAGDIIW